MKKKKKQYSRPEGRAQRPTQRPAKKQGSAPKGTRYLALVATALIATAVFLIYYKTLGGPFVLDDNDYIIKNADIKDLKNMLTPSGTRWLAFLTFAVNYAVGGLDTFGYHLVNTIIHAACAVLVFAFVSLTLRTPTIKRAGIKGAGIKGSERIDPYESGLIALTAALIFAAHPVQTQAVTYISQRFTSMATMLYLASIVLYILWRLGEGSPVKRRAFYSMSLVSTLLAMVTKEISFTLPLMILFYEFTFFSGDGVKKRVTALLPFLATMALIPASIFSAFFLDDGGGDGGATDKLREAQLQDLRALSTHDYMITQFRVIVTYLRLLILPVRQEIDYDYPVYQSIFTPAVFASLLLIVAVISAACYLYMRSRRSGDPRGLVASFGILWFFIALSVESTVIPIADVIFEHRLYLPSVGMAMAFAAAAWWTYDAVRLRTGAKLRPGTFCLILLLATAVPLGTAAAKRNTLWQSATGLFEDMVEKSPRKARAYLGLAKTYEAEGRLPEAEKVLKRVLHMKPDYVMGLMNLGNIYEDTGRPGEAALAYARVLEVRPGMVDARYNLGNALLKTGRTDEAGAEYEQVLAARPDHIMARVNLGTVYGSKGMPEEAVRNFRVALELDPNIISAHFNLGYAYTRMGRLDEARVEFERVLALDPTDTKARDELEGLGR